uniref:tRNA N6-adenosine threonylcarbamoyltransferase n=1 Tax=Fervidicoccus fontis TaxID=683846 RepID=A0A7J3ZL98_9CREN
MWLHRVLREQKVTVLGIESTAHTFGVGVATNRPPFILANSYVRYTPKVGGIHPREASRFLAEAFEGPLRNALEQAGLTINEIDAIAVALGPGMGPCLRVGATIARSLSAYYSKPLVPVNHAIAHIEIGNLLSKFEDPLIVYVSGGNTAIIAYKDGRYRTFGETLDIPLGNLIDTFAREVGLAPPYIKDGVHVTHICAENAKRLLDLPYVVKGQDVSYSGLLTAALRLVEKGERLEDVCYSLLEISFSMITEVAERGLAHTGKQEVLLTGGVSASRLLEEKVRKMALLHEARFYNVPVEYAGDNGAMIAWTGVLAYLNGIVVEPEEATIMQRWRVEEVEVPWRE